MDIKVMVRLATTATVLLLIGFPAVAEDFCRDVLTHAAKNYMGEFSLEQKMAWVYFKKCGSSSSSTEAGVDTIIDAVPLGASFNSSTQKQWCEENKRLDAYQSSYQKIENTVSVPAVQNWSSCMEANSKSLITRVVISPNEAIIQFLVTNRTPNSEKLTQISIQSDEGSGIVCKPEITPKHPFVLLPPNRTVDVDCVRSFVDTNRQGATYHVLPGGSVTLSNTLSPYLFGFRERFRDDVKPADKIPDRLVIPLKGIHVGTMAYWSHGANSALQVCPDRVVPPNNEFELVEVSTREEPVGPWGGRGKCAKAPMCDSHGEFCREVYYSNACFINKKWHEWYKESAASQKVPYSKDAVCGAS